MGYRPARLGRAWNSLQVQTRTGRTPTFRSSANRQAPRLLGWARSQHGETFRQGLSWRKSTAVVVDIAVRPLNERLMGMVWVSGSPRTCGQGLRRSMMVGRNSVTVG